MDFSITVEPSLPRISATADTTFLNDLSAAGFTRIDWCYDWSGKPVFYESDFMALVATTFERFGLSLYSIHGYALPPEKLTFTRELFWAANINRIEFVARLGGAVLVVHLPLHDRPEPAAGIEESLQVLEGLRPAATKAGVRIAVENLYQPRQHTQTTFFDALFARFGPDYLGFCYDSGHASMTGCQDFIERYADRVICTHLHDNDGKDDQHLMPGEGVADWKMILGSLKRSRFAGPVNMELRIPTREPLAPFFTKAMQTIRSLWASAG